MKENAAKEIGNRFKCCAGVWLDERGGRGHILEDCCARAELALSGRPSGLPAQAESKDQHQMKSVDWYEYGSHFQRRGGGVAHDIPARHALPVAGDARGTPGEARGDLREADGGCGGGWGVRAELPVHEVRSRVSCANWWQRKAEIYIEILAPYQPTS